MNKVTEALQAARECIHADRTSFADCSIGPDNTMEPDDAEAVADYDAVLALVDEALAALQSAQPAEVSDADVWELWIRVCAESDNLSTRVMIANFARAILALRPQSESAAPPVEAAREMGAKGGPVVEAERLAFEAWMAGHCWAVSPTWNGKTYDDSEEDKKRKLLDPLARTTRMLWAAWRDRAALSSLRPQAVPMTDAWIDDAMRLADAYADASFDQGLNQRTEDPNPEAKREKLAEHLHGITAQAKEGGA